MDLGPGPKKRAADGARESRPGSTRWGTAHSYRSPPANGPDGPEDVGLCRLFQPRLGGLKLTGLSFDGPQKSPQTFYLPLKRSSPKVQKVFKVHELRK